MIDDLFDSNDFSNRIDSKISVEILGSSIPKKLSEYSKILFLGEKSDIVESGRINTLTTSVNTLLDLDPSKFYFDKEQIENLTKSLEVEVDLTDEIIEKVVSRSGNIQIIDTDFLNDFSTIENFSSAYNILYNGISKNEVIIFDDERELFRKNFLFSQELVNNTNKIKTFLIKNLHIIEKNIIN